MDISVTGTGEVLIRFIDSAIRWRRRSFRSARSIRFFRPSMIRPSTG